MSQEESRHDDVISWIIIHTGEDLVEMRLCLCPWMPVDEIVMKKMFEMDARLSSAFSFAYLSPLSNTASPELTATTKRTGCKRVRPPSIVSSVVVVVVGGLTHHRQSTLSDLRVRAQ